MKKLISLSWHLLDYASSLLDFGRLSVPGALRKELATKYPHAQAVIWYPHFVRTECKYAVRFILADKIICLVFDLWGQDVEID